MPDNEKDLTDLPTENEETDSTQEPAEDHQAEGALEPESGQETEQMSGQEPAQESERPGPILPDAGDSAQIVVAREQLPDILPIIPIRDRPVFPKMMSPVIVTDDSHKQMLTEYLNTGKRMVGLLLIMETEHYPTEAEQKEELYKVGTVGKVIQAQPPQPGQPLQVMLQAIERFEVKNFTTNGHITQAEVSYWYESEMTVNEELKAYSVSIINAIKELIQLKPLFREELNLLMNRIRINEPGTLADFAAFMTTASGAELQDVLETRSIRNRIEKVLLLLKKELEISKLQNKINKQIEEKLSKQQREFFLKEQLKEIKKELGITREDKETELDKFRVRLKNLKLTAEAKERIDEEMDKLQLLEPSSPEFNVTRAYLDWLTILPWGRHSRDKYNLERARNVLDEEHYGLKDIKERIIEFIAVGKVRGQLSGSIILLVGPPGVGKTSIGQSIAKSLGRKFYRFSVGGMRDEAEIKGHRRTYIGALPGKFIHAVKTCKTANPVIMLDEVDKIGASYHGDPASALLEVLDPEQNKDFLDHYLDVRFDLSKVLFICTANQLETIPAPLMDRMEIFKLSGYILEEKMEIAKRHLLPRQLKLHGLQKKGIQIPDETLRAIIDGYAREAGVRVLENNIKKVLRKCAKNIVENKVKQQQITPEQLPDLIGRRVFEEEKPFRQPRVGVVTGLAYTRLGGATLHIEAVKVAAKQPGFKQTGQLGEVMVESSEIAYSYIRSMLSLPRYNSDFFKQHFIHLHVPSGATPKDGPSAGITMGCALYSLAMNTPIRANLAMTGELTLSGLVMPIGGVKEKLLAAKRARISNILFPADNKADYDELEDHIREGIQPYFVENFSQVLEICFPSLSHLHRADEDS